MGESVDTKMGAVRLRCSVQNYDWGRLGADSTVARLSHRNSGAELDPDSPYAELWMGTHDSGPSFVVPDSDDDLAPDSKAVTLKEWINRNPNVLGEKVLRKWGDDLPFLFKVLSVSKALSIQAHPDKELAMLLHERLPDVYKDSNHKPELAIAVSEFKVLCGFVSNEELKNVLVTVPEIIELVGDKDTEKFINYNELNASLDSKAVLRSIFTKIMLASQETVSDAISKLKARLNMENKVRKLTEKEQVVLLLEQQYQADIGVIAAFLINYIKLNPGEALCIGPNEPHAYISGECIECMATSDNVVRAGLTPKYRDVQTLCSMLTFNQGPPEILLGRFLNNYITRYTPPFDEFEVDSFVLPSLESVVFSAIEGPSIFLVMAGEGTMRVGAHAGNEVKIMEGNVFYVPPENEMRLTAAGSGEALRLYRAGVNSS